MSVLLVLQAPSVPPLTGGDVGTSLDAATLQAERRIVGGDTGTSVDATTLEELDNLSEITVGDVIRAESAWLDDSPEHWTALLYADVAE